MEVFVYEGKVKEDILAKAYSDLNVSENESN